MLQWPGDCELSQAISDDGALVSAQTCSFGRARLATVSSETSQKRADQGDRPLQYFIGRWKLEAL